MVKCHSWGGSTGGLLGAGELVGGCHGCGGGARAGEAVARCWTGAGAAFGAVRRTTVVTGGVVVGGISGAVVVGRTSAVSAGAGPTPAPELLSAGPAATTGAAAVAAPCWRAATNPTSAATIPATA